MLKFKHPAPPFFFPSPPILRSFFISPPPPTAPIVNYYCKARGCTTVRRHVAVFAQEIEYFAGVVVAGVLM